MSFHQFASIKHQLVSLLQSKIPYYNDTEHNIGRPCNNQTGCGVFGACMNGICAAKDQHGTVFNMKV